MGQVGDGKPPAPDGVGPLGKDDKVLSLGTTRAEHLDAMRRMGVRGVPAE